MGLAEARLISDRAPRAATPVLIMMNSFEVVKIV